MLKLKVDHAYLCYEDNTRLNDKITELADRINKTLAHYQHKCNKFSELTYSVMRLNDDFRLFIATLPGCDTNPFLIIYNKKTKGFSRVLPYGLIKCLEEETNYGAFDYTIDNIGSYNYRKIQTEKLNKQIRETIRSKDVR